VTQQADRPAAEGRLVVGLVRGVHGLRGAVRIEILTDNPDRFAIGRIVYPEGGDRALTIREAHRDGPGLLVKFAEVRNRDAADALRDTYLEAATTERPEASFYWHEIIGCAVTTTTGEDLGTVDDVFRVGESDVFVVHGPRGEVLVPAVAAIVAELAPAEGRIVVDERALGLVDAADDDTEQP
jgi:16S rRNA processing protein RimM